MSPKCHLPKIDWLNNMYTGYLRVTHCARNLTYTCCMRRNAIAYLDVWQNPSTLKWVINRAYTYTKKEETVHNLYKFVNMNQIQQHFQQAKAHQGSLCLSLCSCTICPCCLGWSFSTVSCDPWIRQICQQFWEDMGWKEKYQPNLRH